MNYNVYILWFSDFALYLEDNLIFERVLGMTQFDQMFDLKLTINY